MVKKLASNWVIGANTCYVVYYPDSGGRLKELMVKGTDIEDLEIVPNPQITPLSLQTTKPDPTTIVPDHSALSAEGPIRLSTVPLVTSSASLSSKALQFLPASVSRPTLSTPQASVHAAKQSQIRDFVDPAILSYDRNQRVSLPSGPPYPTPVSNPLAMPIYPMPTQTHTPAVKTVMPVHHRPAALSDKIYDYVVVDNTTKQEEVEEVTVTKARSRRASKTDQMLQQVQLTESTITDKQKARVKPKGKPRRRKREEIERIAVNDASSPEFARAESAVNGWRETPIIRSPDFVDGVETDVKPAQVTKHLVVSPGGAVAKSKLKKMSRREREKFEAQTGWATEDGATDVQDLPDFDFADNLSKFDKKAVFQQLAAEDDTAIENRLVSFNRVTKPGTFGGTKYHPLENVLGNRKHTKQDSFDFDEDDTGYEVLAVPQMSSRARAMSTKAPPLVKGSKYDGCTNLPSVTSQMSHPRRSMSIIKTSNHAAIDSDSRLHSPALSNGVSPVISATLTAVDFARSLLQKLCPRLRVLPIYLSLIHI